jgi:hypothetical protein
MKDLQEKSNEHKLNLESLNNFLLEKGDDLLDVLLQIEGFKEIDYSNEKVQDHFLEKELMMIPKELWDYDSFCEKMLNKKSECIKFIPKTSDNYYKFCKIAVSSYPFNLIHIDSDFIDYNLCKLAVSSVYTILKLIPEQFIDYNLCKLAVSNNFNNLLYVPKDIENYYLLAEIAINSNPRIFSSIEADVENYYSLCKLAVSKDGLNLESVPYRLRTYEVCYLACSTDYDWSIIYVPEDVENYYSLIKISYSKNKKIVNTYKYIKWSFPKKYIPQLIKDFPEDKKELEKILLREYISKEVKKLLKEYLFK